METTRRFSRTVEDMSDGSDPVAQQPCQPIALCRHNTVQRGRYFDARARTYYHHNRTAIYLRDTLCHKSDMLDSDLLTKQTWLDDLKKALAHLDDIVYLESLHLARHCMADQARSVSAGQRLRRTLLVGIEALAPPMGNGTARLDTRAYEVLYQYAIARRSMTAISSELGLSRRHAYRDLQRGVEALAVIITPQLGTAHSDLGGGDRSYPDLERLLEVRTEETDLHELVSESMQSVAALAAHNSVRIQLHRPAHQLLGNAKRVLLKQAMTGILSAMSGSGERRSGLDIELREESDSVVLSFRRAGAAAQAVRSPKSPHAIAIQMLDLLGLAHTEAHLSDGEWLFEMRIPTRTLLRILILDDNEDLIALFTRYLRHESYVVYGAIDWPDCLRQIGQLRPEVLILDVVMPDRDGWQILQELTIQSGAAMPKIMVCSIINDPDLAFALGADAFLNKPVSRESLLQALSALASPESHLGDPPLATP